METLTKLNKINTIIKEYEIERQKLKIKIKEDYPLKTGDFVQEKEKGYKGFVGFINIENDGTVKSKLFKMNKDGTKSKNFYSLSDKIGSDYKGFINLKNYEKIEKIIPKEKVKRKIDYSKKTPKIYINGKDIIKAYNKKQLKDSLNFSQSYIQNYVSDLGDFDNSTNKNKIPTIDLTLLLLEK